MGSVRLNALLRAYFLGKHFTCAQGGRILEKIFEMRKRKAMRRLTQKIRSTCYLVLLFFFSACGASRVTTSPVLKIKGSDTMVILTQRWAEEFMKRTPGVSIYVEGGGSATGIAALIKGEVQICASSRPIRPEEVRRLVQARDFLGVSHLVAQDALSIYVHPQNPVQRLSLAQVQAIFTGAITNWKTLGGINAPITVLTRSPNSGTYLYFQEHALAAQDYAAHARSMPTTAAMVEEIARNVAAVGYGGLAYGEKLVHCRLDEVAPTEENVRNGSYPLARYLYFYTIDKPTGTVKAFIDWVLSAAGQTVVREIGYIPLFELP